MGNHQKKQISLLICLYISIILPLYANDFLFTSINTSHGLSDNQIRYILQLPDRKSTRLNSSHLKLSRMPSSA